MLVGQLHLASLCLKSILCFSVFQSCRVRFDFKKFLQTARWNYYFFPCRDLCFSTKANRQAGNRHQYFHSDRLRCHAQKNENTHTPVRVPGLTFWSQNLTCWNSFMSDFPSGALCRYRRWNRRGIFWGAIPIFDTRYRPIGAYPANQARDARYRKKRENKISALSGYARPT